MMTLGKAIEILNLGHAGVISIQSKDYQDASKLGIEALKELLTLRATPLLGEWEMLPGETKD